MSLAPGAPSVMLTAALLPDVRWTIEANRPGWSLRDESAKAALVAKRVHEEIYDATDATAIMILTHPFWTELPSDNGLILPAIRRSSMRCVSSWSVHPAGAETHAGETR